MLYKESPYPRANALIVPDKLSNGDAHGSEKLINFFVLFSLAISWASGVVGVGPTFETFSVRQPYIG